MLRLLSEKFSMIAEYQCKQYFELFCELIDHYFVTMQIGVNREAQVFNPESLLSLIIDRIKAYNQLRSNTEAAQEDQESIYVGLVQLTGKIIDNFDIKMSERIVESKNLIDEIFKNFLFASIFQHQT